MNASLILTLGESALTLLDLIRRAANYKGLTLQEGASRAYSEQIKEYTLDEKLFALLAKCGVKRQDHFEIKCDVFRLTLYIGFGLSKERRGVILVPEVIGTTGPFVPERGRFPTFKVFKTLVENDPDLPPAAKELAASDGTIVVTWTELGLGGVRRLVDLFGEFAGSNERVLELGRRREVFDPTPYSHYRHPGDELFISEPVQPKIVETWRAQLNEYRSQLVV